MSLVTLLVLAHIVLVSLVTVAMLRAPQGYEDASGFHLGAPEEAGTASRPRATFDRSLFPTFERDASFAAGSEPVRVHCLSQMSEEPAVSLHG